MKNILTLLLILLIGCTEVEQNQTEIAEDITTEDFAPFRDKLSDFITAQHIDFNRVDIVFDFLGSYSTSDPSVKYIFEFPNHEYCERVTEARIVIIDPEAK